MPRLVLLAAAALLATGARAQPPPALDLKLPPQAVPAAASTAAAAAPAASAASAPGAYYGDTSGRPATADTDACDQTRFAQPQVHGELETGFAVGGHASGQWNAGRVTLSRAFGSCEHPTGGVSISIGAADMHTHGRHP